jgi:hypothetical protein
MSSKERSLFLERYLLTLMTDSNGLLSTGLDQLFLQFLLLRRSRNCERTMKYIIFVFVQAVLLVSVYGFTVLSLRVQQSPFTRTKFILGVNRAYRCCKDIVAITSFEARKFTTVRTTHKYLSSPALLLSQTPLMESTEKNLNGSESHGHDNTVQELLDMARRMGPVGVRNSLEDQELINDAALRLQQQQLGLSNAVAAVSYTDVPLLGVHELIYSAASGGSSGKIGPIHGKVMQTFVNATTFINSVELGPLRIALTATRKIKNETSFVVKFQSTTVSLFNIPIIEKSVVGGGIWNILYTGIVHDKNDVEHPMRLLRVMHTPSLFIIEQKL